MRSFEQACGVAFPSDVILLLTACCLGVFAHACLAVCCREDPAYLISPDARTHQPTHELRWVLGKISAPVAAFIGGKSGGQGTGRDTHAD